jgi:hypothetical protein
MSREATGSSYFCIMLYKTRAALLTVIAASTSAITVGAARS